MMSICNKNALITSVNVTINLKIIVCAIIFQAFTRNLASLCF